MSSTIEEWERKRKKALIAILTLGLSETPFVKLLENSSDADKGFSFEGGFTGFIFRCFWFLLWTVITTGVLWIVNIFKFINYDLSIRMSRNKQSY